MSVRIVAVAHFPPPVHGMAAAVDALVSRLERVAVVRRVGIGAPDLHRSPGYHRVRVARVLRALAVLATERRRTARAFFSCDAGPGMVYTFILVVWARALGYWIQLQHHSYAYVEHRSPILAAIVRIGGRACEHLVICQEMARDLHAAYPRTHTRVVGVASGVPLTPTPSPAPDPDVPPGRLVLGFLGNVTVEKGVDVAIATARAAVAGGIPVELHVAGPVVDPEADRLLTGAAAAPGAPVRRVGAVYGTERDAFLDAIDVFLFPSRYPHESFGLVAFEAMARGIPVIAVKAGCLTRAAVGAGGRVVDRDADYVDAAVAALRHWWDEPVVLGTAGREARVRAAAVIEAAERDAELLCRDLAAGGEPVRSGGSP